MSEAGSTKSFPTKFRRRLALFCTAAVAVSSALFGVGSFLFIRQDKLQRFEVNARREVRLQLRTATSRAGDDVGQLARDLATAGRAEVVMVGEAVISSGDRVDVSGVPPSLRGEPPEGLPTAVAETAQGSFLVVAGRVPTTSTTAYFFFDRQQVSHELAMVARALAAAWAVVVVAAAAASSRLARRALWPVRRSAAAAADLAGGLLGTRLPVEGDDEFAAWAASFNHMVDELQRRIERERRFTADVAHELRTPLGSLLTAASMLDTNVDALPPSVRRPAELIVQELRRLRRLVDDLLEVSRLESGHDGLVVTDVELRERVRQLLVARGWAGRVRLEGPHLRVATDARRIDRIVGNLVDNALRHGREPVVVTLGQARDGILVEVADAGEGIPADDLSRVFEPFFKRDPSRRGPGSGLGLAIAVEHARVLGGRIEVASDRARGTRFALVLPGGDVVSDGGREGRT